MNERRPAGRPTVIVVGSVNRDYVVRVPRLPDAGETVIGGTFAEGLGGKGANQAASAARLGAVSRLIATVGRDPGGEASVAELRRFGVDTGSVEAIESRTGVALIVVDDRGENQIAVASGANAELRAPSVTSAIRGSTAATAVVLANLEVPDDAVLAAARAAAAQGYAFVLNPAPARRLPAALLALRATPSRRRLPWRSPRASRSSRPSGGRPRRAHRTEAVGAQAGLPERAAVAARLARIDGRPG